MGKCVCMGAAIQCSFGMAPSVLVANAQVQTMTSGMVAANIMDNKPMLNIMPFGMCMSAANPQMSVAPSVAVSPKTGSPIVVCPCVPSTPAPWVPGSPTVMVGGKPALNDSSTLMCAYGGVITVANAGQMTVQVP